MASPKTQSNFLPAPGELVFKGPLTYYTSETDAIGRLNLNRENAGKKFLVIPIDGSS